MRVEVRGIAGCLYSQGQFKVFKYYPSCVPLVCRDSSFSVVLLYSVVIIIFFTKNHFKSSKKPTGYGDFDQNGFELTYKLMQEFIERKEPKIFLFCQFYDEIFYPN